MQKDPVYWVTGCQALQGPKFYKHASVKPVHQLELVVTQGTWCNGQGSWCTPRSFTTVACGVKNMPNTDIRGRFQSFKSHASWYAQIQTMWLLDVINMRIYSSTPRNTNPSIIARVPGGKLLYPTTLYNPSYYFLFSVHFNFILCLLYYSTL